MVDIGGSTLRDVEPRVAEFTFDNGRAFGPRQQVMTHVIAAVH